MKTAVQDVRGLRFWEVWIDSICTMVEPVGYRAIDDVGSDGERFRVLEPGLYEARDCIVMDK